MKKRLAHLIAGSIFMVNFFFAQPSDVQEEYRIINGARLYTKVMGKGQPIVILHGGPGLDHTYLLPQMAKLADHYRLIFMDLRAHGRSSVDIDSNAMTLANFVEDIEGIRESFKLQKMNLMGHSWGGLVAMSYAIKYHQHLSSLLLINTAPASSELRDKVEMIARSRITKDDSVARSALMRTDAFRKRTPEVIESLFRIVFRGSFYDRRYADSLTLTFQPNYPASSAMLQHLFKDRTLVKYDIHEKLRTVQCRTLIAGGDYDHVSPEMLEDIRNSIPDSKLFVLNNCGHFLYIECPEQFIGIIRGFLQ